MRVRVNLVCESLSVGISVSASVSMRVRVSVFVLALVTTRGKNERAKFWIRNHDPTFAFLVESLVVVGWMGGGV